MAPGSCTGTSGTAFLRRSDTLSPRYAACDTHGADDPGPTASTAERTAPETGSAMTRRTSACVSRTGAGAPAISSSPARTAASSVPAVSSRTTVRPSFPSARRPTAARSAGATRTVLRRGGADTCPGFTQCSCTTAAHCTNARVDTCGGGHCVCGATGAPCPIGQTCVGGACTPG